MSFLFLVPSSMLSTVSALGAQNIGAGKRKRAVRTLRYAIILSVGFELLISIGIQFGAENMVALFTDRTTAGGNEVIRLGGQYLRGYIWDSVFAGIHFSFSGYFCACGKSGLSFLQERGEEQNKQLNSKFHYEQTHMNAYGLQFRIEKALCDKSMKIGYFYVSVKDCLGKGIHVSHAGGMEEAKQYKKGDNTTDLTVMAYRFGYVDINQIEGIRYDGKYYGVEEAK